MSVLASDWQKLLQAAAEARRRAHAPYSGFAVGAALLDADGGIHAGCNVENASYGLTVCAERNALAAWVIAGKPEPEALVVLTGASDPTPPCGACRQVMGELLPAALPVRAATVAGQQVDASVGELLPWGFTKASLD